MEVKNIDIGQGLPKIVVTTTPDSHKHISECFNYYHYYMESFDLLEIRADYFDEEPDYNHIKIVNELSEKFAACPIIYTYRSAREGGEGKRSLEACQALLNQVISSCNIDFVDVEYLMDEQIVGDIIDEAKKNSVKVLLSNHNFFETPSLEEMQKLLYRMHTAGGDILKIAYQPSSAVDILNVMNAVYKAKLSLGNKVIGISMGEEGIITRLIGGAFSSCMTYGFLEQTAAPGQVHASKIRQALKAYEKSLN